MSQPIGPIAQIKPLLPLDAQFTGQAAVNDGSDFSAVLKNALDNLEKSQVEGEAISAALATGQVEDFHTPVIALEKASLTLGLAVNVRNKVIDAYREIMRMQI